MNINGYVPFLKNTLDTIMSGRFIQLIKSAATRSRLHDVGVREAKHSRHAANPPQASEGHPKALTILGSASFIT